MLGSAFLCRCGRIAKVKKRMVGRIEKRHGKMRESKFAITVNEVQYFHDRSEFDKIVDSFVFGFIQGMKAAKEGVKNG